MKFSNILGSNFKIKIIISLVMFLAVIAVLVNSIALPAAKDIKRMGTDIEGQRIDLEKKYLKGQSIRKLLENLKKIEPQLDKLNQVFINQNRELEFIITVEAKAVANNIQQKINMGAAQNTDQANFKKMPLQLFTTGNFISQYNYLKSLEALGYYINVKTLELSTAPTAAADAAESRQNNLNMFIAADTYWE